MPPASEDEYDNFSDDFGDLDLSNVPGLAYDDAVATVSAQSTTSPPQSRHLDEVHAPVAAAATPSDLYSFDELDDTFLAEVDELDQLLTQHVARTQPVEEPPAATQPVSTNANAEAGSSLYAASSSASIEEVDKELGSTNDRHAQATSRFFETSVDPQLALSAVNPRSLPRPPRSSIRSSKKKGVEIDEPIPWSLALKADGAPCKRVRTGSSTPTQLTPTKRHKGKDKESPSAGVRRILSEFEDEMTCPICCDIFAAAHLGNPCGHSFCGECGWNWIAKNPRAPTCAICRAALTAATPMIPNFAMDNTIEKQLHALGQHGIDDWEEGGAKLAEWRARKEKWKSGAAQRAKVTSAPHAPAQRTRPLDRELSGSFIEPDDEEDHDYSDESDEEDEGSGEAQSTQENVPWPAIGIAVGAWQGVPQGGPPPRRRGRLRWNRGGDNNNNTNGRGGRGYRGNRGGGRGGGGRGGRGRGRGNFGRGGAA